MDERELEAMDRREFVKLSAVAAGTVAMGTAGRCAWPGVSPQVQPTPAIKEFTFAFITDPHVRVGMHAEYLQRCIRIINESNPCDFAITGGDLIDDGLEQNYEITRGYYDLFESIMAELKVPVYHTIGNHDLFGVYDASGVSPDHPEYGKEMYRRCIGGGRTYYSFDHGDWHFISLDSTQIKGRKFVGGVDEPQLDVTEFNSDVTELNSDVTELNSVTS